MSQVIISNLKTQLTYTEIWMKLNRTTNALFKLNLNISNIFLATATVIVHF